jgi:GT2 family glycosyltransferase
VTGAPSVSIVIPTADRPAQLGCCLRALAGIDYPRERLQVLVVDDAGAADVRALCGSAHNDLRVTLIRRDRRAGPGAARNTGAAAAEGELLAFTDDDCRPERGWLWALARATGSGIAAGGRTVNVLAGNSFAAASQYIQDLVYEHYNRDADAARFFASNNLAVPADDFRAVGGFDAAGFPFAAEDRDFCDRWQASGRRLRYSADAVVGHAHDLALAGFIRQHVAYGRGAARYQRARAARGTGRLRDDARFHLDPALWGRTLAQRPARRAARTVALLSLWQAANAAGYALERVHAG